MVEDKCCDTSQRIRFYLPRHLENEHFSTNESQRNKTRLSADLLRLRGENQLI